MNFLSIFRTASYLWPGIDGAADLLQASSKTRLQGRVSEYFKELRSAYGRDVLAMTFGIFGNEATFDHADAVKRNFEALEARARETPNLMPLFGLGLAFDRVAADTGVFRARAINQHLTPAGWRWLSQQPRATVRRLAKNGLTPPAIAWINLLAKAGAPLPSWLAEENGVYRLSDLTDQAIGIVNAPEKFARAESSLLSFLRLALRSAADKSLAANRAAFVQQYELVAIELVRRFRTENAGGFNPGSWQNICEQIERAFLEREAIAAQLQGALKLEELANSAKQKELASRTWTSAVPATTLRGVDVRPLCNNADLVAEGIVMDHCLKDGSYLPLLTSGKGRAFSLRGAVTAFRATLMIVQTPRGDWIVSQLKAAANAKAPAVFYSVARDICDLYTKSSNQSARQRS